MQHGKDVDAFIQDVKIASHFLFGRKISYNEELPLGMLKIFN